MASDMNLAVIVYLGRMQNSRNTTSVGGGGRDVPYLHALLKANVHQGPPRAPDPGWRVASHRRPLARTQL